MTSPELAKRLEAKIDLPPRQVLVTGASRGIGAAIARELAACGARVTLVSRRQEQVEAVRLQLPNPETHLAYQADVTDPTQVKSMVAFAESAMGAPLYALVNNAGGGEAVAFADTDEAHWRRMIDVNLMSAVFCTRVVLPNMQRQRAGRVINIGSIASLRGFRHVAAYTAAKHALLGFARTLALEVERDGVVVSTVCPGYTETEMLGESIGAASARTGRSEADIRARFEASNKGGRLVQSSEVARVVAWLCSDDAAGMNGKNVLLDGAPPEVFS